MFHQVFNIKCQALNGSTTKATVVRLGLCLVHGCIFGLAELVLAAPELVFVK